MPCLSCLSCCCRWPSCSAQRADSNNPAPSSASPRIRPGLFSCPDARTSAQCRKYAHRSQCRYNVLWADFVFGIYLIALPRCRVSCVALARRTTPYARRRIARRIQSPPSRKKAPPEAAPHFCGGFERGFIRFLSQFERESRSAYMDLIVD